MSQVLAWRAARVQAERRLAANDVEIVDYARRLSRLEAEVELAEHAAKKRGR